MPEIHELDLPTCERLIRRGAFGRFAFISPRGPEIVPVNYAVQDRSVVVRTAPDSALARHGAGAELVFEVDAVDHEYWNGFSVVVRGVGEVLEPPATPKAGTVPPRPWAGGDRSCTLRMTWTEISGRAVGRQTGLDALLPVGRTR
jgi:nitroimidazol reductase NimA-like FMN-containing flavoprotein (pyridoxamine 5'-phosphate oxidase superfamily)